MQPEEAAMRRRIIRLIVLSLVRLFYPRIHVQGRERLPASGPVIFVANHPNGLLDPLLLTAAAQRPVRFLTASYLFRYPALRQCMQAFGALPVYREQDRDTWPEGAADVAQANEVAFTRCRAWLREQGALALFPEGTTHDDPKLRRLRSGAARIALGAEAEAGWQLGLRVVPVGLWYESKTLFRSSVLLVIGEPFTLASYAEKYTHKPTQSLHVLTRQMAEKLGEVVLQAENRELLDAMPVIAGWTHGEGRSLTLAERHERAGELLEAYQRLARNDPERLARLAEQAREYDRALRQMGVDDPWALEAPAPHPWHIAGRALLLTVSFPAALAGAALSYAPYRLARPIARRFAGPGATQTGHTKLIAGSALVFLTWSLQAIVVGIARGPRRGALLFILQPLLGYIALRWGEAARPLRETLRYDVIRRRRHPLVRQLAERRRALAGEIAAAIDLLRDEPRMSPGR